MKNKIISSRYAQALLEVAKKNNQVEPVLKETQLFSQQWQENKKLKVFLSNPDLTKEEKKQFFEHSFARLISRTFLNFLYILIDKNRLDYLPDMAEMYRKLSYELKGIEEVVAVSAHPIDRELLDTLKNRLKKIINKEVKLEPEVNPEILGGVTLRFRDKIIDGSLKYNLKQLREELLKTKVS